LRKEQRSIATLLIRNCGVDEGASLEAFFCRRWPQKETPFGRRSFSDAKQGWYVRMTLGHRELSHTQFLRGKTPEGVKAGSFFRGQLPMVPGDIELIPDRWPQLRFLVLDCLFFPHAEVVMKRQADGLSSIANDMAAEESPHEAGFGGLAWYLGYG
jgi:hypothetical protein